MRFDFSRDALYRPATRPVFVELDGWRADPVVPAPVFGRSPDPSAAGTGVGTFATDLSTWWWLANAAHLAYYAPDDIAAELERAGLTLYRWISADSTQCFVARNEHAALVAFRGTEPGDWHDAWADLDFALEPFRGDARVHRGFRRALAEVSGDLTDVLGGLAAEGVPVWFTGHSLGAALASLAAATWQPAGVVTFGSPRVGNPAFRALLEATAIPVTRVANCTDLVTRVPPRVTGFAHVGDLRFITHRGHLLHNPGAMRQWRCRVAGVIRFTGRMPLLRRGMVSVRHLADHAVVNYARALGWQLARWRRRAARGA